MLSLNTNVLLNVNIIIILVIILHACVINS